MLVKNQLTGKKRKQNWEKAAVLPFRSVKASANLVDVPSIRILHTRLK
jgi:hypothetical protein